MIGNIGCPWTVSSLDTWINATASGNRVTFSVDQNTTADIRYGTIVVSVYGRSYLYSISQDAANAACWLSLSSDQSVMQTEAGSGTFELTTPNACSWSFQSDSPWLTPSQATLQGSRQVGFTVDPNFGSARSGIITIQGGETSAQYIVHQLKGALSHFDYDADSLADLSVRRPSDDNWYVLRGTAGYMVMTFGVAGDLMVPADYDGDGKTDIAMFRPSNGTWYTFNSQSQSFTTVGWGANGDLPVPADHDGDGKADLVVFRPSTNTWYTRFANGTFSTTVFGVAGDKPVVGDFDGDGKADIALYRPAESNWYILKTGFGFFIQTWGQAGDIPVPADYDGDGATDVAVFRPSTGQWFRVRSTAGFDTVNWGANGDKPIPADYDGDGKSDVAVFRESNSTWYIVGSTSGQLIQQYGVAGDVPTEGAFIY